MHVNRVTSEYKIQSAKTPVSLKQISTKQDRVSFTANALKPDFKVMQAHVKAASDMASDYSRFTPMEDARAQEKNLIKSITLQLAKGAEALETLEKVYLPETSLEYIADDLKIINEENAQEEKERILDAITVISSDKMLKGVNAGTTIEEIDSYFGKSLDNTEASELQDIVVSMTDVYNALALLKASFTSDMTLGEIQGKTLKAVNEVKNPNNDALSKLIDVIKDSFVPVFEELNDDYMPMSTTLKDCKKILEDKKERRAKAENRVKLADQALFLASLPQNVFEKLEKAMYPLGGESVTYMPILFQNWIRKQN